MSLITTPILRYFYDLSISNIESNSTSSAFWQHYLTQAFADLQTYSITSPVSPHPSRRPMDIVVKQYDADHHSMTSLLLVLYKRPGEDLREVEEQAFDAAKRCVQSENLLFIYVMTTVGVSFRVWVYEKGGDGLAPCHGEATEGDWTQYVDADSERAWVLSRCLAVRDGEGGSRWMKMGMPGTEVGIEVDMALLERCSLRRSAGRP